MAEFTNTAIQQVDIDGNVRFAETPICGTKCIIHREGSGIVTLKGMTDQCFARYSVKFSGNIAAVTTAAAISLAIALNGEEIEASEMIVTPAAVDEYFNVSNEVVICVPKACCYTLSVKNTSGQLLNVQNANLIVRRTA